MPLFIKSGYWYKTDKAPKSWLNLSALLGAGIESLVAGTNVDIDNTDPLNPVISATGSSDTAANVFVGNAGATLTNETLVAGRYSGVSAADILNFQIDANNNVSYRLEKDVIFNEAAFRNSAVPGITYYIDIDGKTIDTKYGAANQFRDNDNNFISIVNGLRRGGYNIWALSTNIELICANSMIPFGWQVDGDSLFTSSTFAGTGNIVYADITNQTINGGGPDGDLTGAVATRLSYATNKNRPMYVDAIISTVLGNTTIDGVINEVFHSNSIDWYLVFVDGVYKGKSATTAFSITGLESSTTYAVKFLTIDSMGNNSKFSQEFNLTTTT